MVRPVEEENYLDVPGRTSQQLPLTIMSNGVAGNLNGTLGMPTQTNTPRGRSICRLCSYARSPLAVQITACAPSPDVKDFTAATMSTSEKSRNSVAPSDRHNPLFLGPLWCHLLVACFGWTPYKNNGIAYLSIARTLRPFLAAICTPLHIHM